MSYKPEYLLINFSRGELVGWGTDTQVRKQLLKAVGQTSDSATATYLIARVETMSRMERVET